MDGDTITVLKDFQQYKVRLAEIDAPEKTQPFGNQAKIVLSDKIFGKEVTVKVKEKDRYGRYVGYVEYENKNINLEMVKEGYAWQYKHYSHDSKYAQAEMHAKTNNLGLWNFPIQTPPWEFRSASKNTSKKKKK